MKRLALALVVALAACGGGGGGGGGVAFPVPGAGPLVPSEPVVVAPKPVVCTVELDGDSILNGTSLRGMLLTPPATYIKQVRPKYEVTDNTEAGASANLFVSRFYSAQRTAKIIVINYGVNDNAKGWSIDKPVRDMTTVSKAEGRAVILTGIIPLAGLEKINDVHRLIAEQEAVQFADWGSLPGYEPIDGVHPTQQSSNRLMDLVIEKMDLIAPECV